jgi:hypothetical protein
MARMERPGSGLGRPDDKLHIIELRTEVGPRNDFGNCGVRRGDEPTSLTQGSFSALGPSRSVTQKGTAIGAGKRFDVG